MTPLGIRRSLAASVLVALGLVTLIGCSSLPTAPAPADHATLSMESHIVRARAPAGLLSGLTELVTGTLNALTKTVQTITGHDGGVVRKGRFAVEVPPGAFNGAGEITVEVPDSLELRVELHIRNVPNDFDVPVTLEVSYAGLDSPDVSPAHLSIFWHDEVAGVWRKLPTTVDTQRQVLSTPLEHFSTYAVFELEAKAGW
jgi:hypothetical protein